MKYNNLKESNITLLPSLVATMDRLATGNVVSGFILYMSN